jgi:hypothetical protein
MHNFPGNSTTTALVVSASQASTVTSSAFDLQPFEGFALVVQNKGTGTGTLDGKLQHSDDGVSNWVDTGLAFTQATTTANLQAISFDTKALRRFARYVGTIATGPHLLGVTITGARKYL